MSGEVNGGFIALKAPESSEGFVFGMASRSRFSCYKPTAMTNIRSGSVRFALLALVFGLGGCSMFSSKPHDTLASGANLPPADVLYAQGIADVQKQDFEHAVTKFDQVEENYPYSTWATHAQLLAGYSQYKQQNYDDALSALNRFIALHPENPDVAYAYYLKALCYYEQIDDVQRDQTTTYEAIQTLTDVTTRFPESSYARDARIKLRLAQNRLAGHDMAIGRFYEKQHLYAAAIGRYQDVITSFQTTTYTAEALERLVECYLDLGLTGAAQRTASVLAYNYPGSTWYQSAYSKLKDHDLVQNAAQANSGQTSATPAAPKSHWFWIF
jgi:outer membrane protein assembly factor BamD